ncbi:MAG: AMP-binding protein [Gemmatimonadetes bacterium]|nr:AMP-binding protein [Gemmatimonadota bacterium]
MMPPPLGALVDPFRWWSALTPDKVAVVDRVQGTRATYREMDAAARRWADYLATRGVRRGDRVALLALNRIEIIGLFYGCVRLGAALVPLNWRLAEPELARVLADARVALVLGEARFAAVGRAATGVPFVAFEDACTACTAIPCRAEAPLGAEAIDSEATALILYTSGSTGRPKGAMLSNRQLLFNAVATLIGWQLGAGDIGPISTPFFHTGGWNVVAIPLWTVGGTVVLLDAFDPARFLDILHEERVSIAFAVPTQFVMLLAQPNFGRPLPRLRNFMSGGAPLPQSVADRVRTGGYAIREGFGMTEFGVNCFMISEAQALAKPGSVGWPMPFVEMRLVDEALADVPDGAVGELLLRGPQLFSGYLFDAERTAEAMTPDGWFRSGDLALRDPDGAFHIRGRRKDMFISGGENVFPGEVEAALSECSGVSEAVVVGVPDERWGEVGHCFLFPKEGRALDGGAVLAELRTRIAAYKVPKRVTVLGEPPRLASGKLDRTRLAAMAGPI